MACLLALLPAAGHDQMWCLYAARLVLHGSRLYGPELYESNPPLIVWLSTVPVALAAWLRLPETLVGKALLLLLGAAAALVCRLLLGRIFAERRERLGSSAAWAWGFVAVTVFAVVPARDFGQRDHILAVLCLPYVLAAALDAEGGRLSLLAGLALGLAAGVGIALKPHQAVLVVAVEAALLALRSSRRGTFDATSLRRPEPWTILACGAAYLLLIRHFTPVYLAHIVPVLRDTYWAFGHLTWPQLVAEAPQLHLLGAATLAVALARGWQRASALTLLLAAAGVASTLAYYLQGTGWYYQQLPALSFFAFALLSALLDRTQRSSVKLPLQAPRMALALVLLALALTTHFAGYPFTQARSFPIETPDPGFYAGLAPGTPVATLTTTVDDTVPPVFRYHLLLAQRYPHLWMLPAILRAESGERAMPAAQLAALEDLQHTAMREDFARWQPRLVLVERCQDSAVHCQVLEDRHDDLLAWFLRDPAFRSQFAGYRYLRSAGSFDAYVPR